MTSAHTDTDLSRRIRAGAVAIHRTFAPIHQLLAEVERLALNASVACGRLGGAGRSFATVARDLHATSTELASRIVEIEGVFEGLSHDVSAWSECERRLRVHERACAEVVAQGVAGERGASTLCRARERALNERSQRISALAARIQSLDGHVDRIRWTAVRQTRYLCILASIERAHLGTKGEAVEAVVAAMGVLADRLGAVEEEARDRVLALRMQVRRLRRREDTRLNDTSEQELAA